MRNPSPLLPFLLLSTLFMAVATDAQPVGLDDCAKPSPYTLPIEGLEYIQIVNAGYDPLSLGLAVTQWNQCNLTTSSAPELVLNVPPAGSTSMTVSVRFDDTNNPGDVCNPSSCGCFRPTWEDDEGSGRYRITGGQVQVYSATGSGSPCGAFDPAFFPNLALHELGHVLGLAEPVHHDNCAGRPMGHGTLTPAYVTAADCKAVDQIHYGYDVSGSVGVDANEEGEGFTVSLKLDATPPSGSTELPFSDTIGPFVAIPGVPETQTFAFPSHLPVGWTWSVDTVGANGLEVECAPIGPSSGTVDGPVQGVGFSCADQQECEDTTCEPSFETFPITGTLSLDALDSHDIGIGGVEVKLSAEPPSSSTENPFEVTAEGSFYVAPLWAEDFPVSFPAEVPIGWTWRVDVTSTTPEATCWSGGGGVMDGEVTDITMGCQVYDDPGPGDESFCDLFPDMCDTGTNWFTDCDVDSTTEIVSTWDGYDYISTSHTRITINCYYVYGTAGEPGAEKSTTLLWQGPDLGLSVAIIENGELPRVLAGDPFAFYGTYSDPDGVEPLVFQLDSQTFVPLGLVDADGSYSGSIDTGSLDPGIHELEVFASDSHPTNPSPAVASARFEVVEPPAVCDTDADGPTVDFVPADGAFLASGPNGIDISASDGSGIDRIRVFVDDIAEGLLRTEPWLHLWQAPQGEHEILVRAFDICDNKTDLRHTVTICDDAVSPTVDLTSPASGAALVPGGTVTLEATASDDVGVTKVQFVRDGGLLIGADTEAPFELDWVVEAGTTEIKARAFDACGNFGVDSHPVTATVPCDGVVDSLSLTHPTSGTSLYEGEAITLTTHAADANGIEEVAWWARQGRRWVFLGSDTTEPYTLDWTVAANASQIRTGARDTCANNAMLAEPITVGPPPSCDSAIDSLTLTNPANGAVLGEGQSLTLTATASDADGITQVTFARQDGTVIGTDTTAPYQVPWTAELGVTGIRARTWDTCGNTLLVQNAVTVEPACDSVIDSLTLTNPANGAVLGEGQSLTLTAAASDADGISQVTFARQDGTVIGTDTTAPYQVPWTAELGVTGIRARTWDTCGNTLLVEHAITVEPGCDSVVDSVDLTSPSIGASPSEGQSVVLAATASDSQGIEKVQFVDQDGNLLGADFTAPYSMAWTATLGTTAIKARAWDNCGNYAVESHWITVSPSCDSVVDSVDLTSPSSGASLSEGQSVVVAATAFDSQGIEKVQFVDQDGNLLGTDFSSPYSLAWTATLGTTEIKARAYDTCGNFLADAHAITVNAACDAVVDSVALTSPADGASYDEGQTVTLDATAADNQGIEKVQFVDQDGNLLGTDFTAPYSLAWTATLGTTEIKARAWDNCGNFLADAHAITVNAACDGIVDSVSLTSPAQGASYDEGQTVTLTATAADNQGIEKVQFVDQDGNLLGTDFTAPYSIIWVADASVTEIKARAWDNCDNFLADAHSITVNPTCDSVVDSVTLTSPAHGATLTIGQTITLTATASDGQGIEKVQFVDQDGNLLGADFSSPYSLSWTVQSGTTALKARAWDNCGNFAADENGVSVQ